MTRPSRWEVHHRAQNLLDLNRPQAADEILRAHLRDEPEDGSALLLLGRAHGDQKRYSEAERSIRGAIRLDPESYEAHLALTEVLSDREDVERAVFAARETVRLGPDRWTSHYALGRALLLGDRPRTREGLRSAIQAVRLAPHAAAAHNLVGVCYLNLGEEKDARRAFEEAVRLDPQHALAQANLANLDARQGRLRRGAQRLTTALSQHPQESYLHETLDVIVARFIRRMYWLVLASAATVGVLIIAKAPYLARVATGAVLAAAVYLVVRRFLGHLPRGARSLSTIARAARRLTRFNVVLIGLLLACVVLMAWAPYEIALVAGAALLVVFRALLIGMIVGGVVGAIRNLGSGR